MSYRGLATFCSMSRPQLSREVSYSLDLPRTSSPIFSPYSPIVIAETTIPPTSPSSKRTSIAADFGLSHLPEDESTTYTVWNAGLTNMRVCPIDLTSSSNCYYYVEARSFVPNKPGITLHFGTSKDSPTIGVGHLDYFSTSNLLGLGDPERDPTAVVWERLHKESFWTHMRYSFSLEEKDGMVLYEWHRTKNLYWVADQGDLVLVEQGKQDVLAEYKGKGVLGQVKKQRGSLSIKQKNNGDAWERMVILTWASILELQRRRTRERRVGTLFGRII